MKPRSLFVPVAALLLGLCYLGVAEETAPAAKAQPFGNFALIDHNGQSHELDYYFRIPEVKAVALFVHGVGCPLVQKRLPELERLRARYQSKGILFAMINANPQDDAADIAAEAKEFRIAMPILIDSAQIVAGMLGLRRTAEILLLEKESRTVAYRGPIDNRMSYQKEKPTAENTYFTDALDALLAGREISESRIGNAPGCLITLPDEDFGKDISYAETIAPLVREKCVRCHTKGGIAPFAMSSYQKVRGWSAMMREMLLTRQMPPWQADPAHGHFSNDLSLTPLQTQQLVAWIDADCPRGEGADPLEGYAPESPEWALGEPDHIIAIEPQTIPAEGIIDYRYIVLDSPFDRDVWLRAVQIDPGNTRVLHHVIVSGYRRGADGKKSEHRSIAGYAPGMTAYVFPEGAGVLVPKGSKIEFQLHYTASGKPETDSTRLGFWLHGAPPEKEFHTDVIIESKFRIPPGQREHVVAKSKTLRHDILLYSMNPHMHFRGKAMRYDAILPDGSRQRLLSVPAYNFNWQRDYLLAEPLPLPAGTRIEVTAAWDNSALNPHNPDPNREIRWGEQSFDEMFFASFKFTVAD